jgi:DNA-binding response OmpR family regulator
VPTGRPGLLIDPHSRRAQLDGEALGLTGTEFELLHYLARHPGRAELLGNLWPDPGQAPGVRAIDVRIRRLRTKLGRVAGVLCTVRGQGYRFHDHPDVTFGALPTGRPA